jgi:hypothetical protein
MERLPKTQLMNTRTLNKQNKPGTELLLAAAFKTSKGQPVLVCYHFTPCPAAKGVLLSISLSGSGNSRMLLGYTRNAMLQQQTALFAVAALRYFFWLHGPARVLMLVTAMADAAVLAGIGVELRNNPGWGLAIDTVPAQTAENPKKLQRPSVWSITHFTKQKKSKQPFEVIGQQHPQVLHYLRCLTVVSGVQKKIRKAIKGMKKQQSPATMMGELKKELNKLYAAIEALRQTGMLVQLPYKTPDSGTAARIKQALRLLKNKGNTGKC